MNKFCIVTITLNNIEGLRRTAQSIANQTYKNWTWIVVDGLSKDGTQDYLATLDIDNKIVLSERDTGIYDAMNKGLSLVPPDCDYLIFLNAGDSFYDPSTLEIVSNKISNYVAERSQLPAIVYGDSVRTFPNSERVLYRRHKRIDWIKIGMFCEHQAIFFSCRHINGLRHNPRLRYSGDYDFIIKFCKLNACTQSDAADLNVPICRFAFGGVSHTQRNKALKEEFFIRTTVFEMSNTRASALYLAHYLHHKIKKIIYR